jgi:hypothetical protein
LKHGITTQTEWLSSRKQATNSGEVEGEGFREERGGVRDPYTLLANVN